MQVLNIENYAILMKEAKDDEIPGEICNRYKLELEDLTYKEVFTPQTDSFNAILIKIPGSFLTYEHYYTRIYTEGKGIRIATIFKKSMDA